MNDFRRKMNAKFFLDRANADSVWVSLPIQYKPKFVEDSTGCQLTCAPIFDDRTRTFLCTEEEWLAFDREFPTIAKRLDPMLTVTQLESFKR